MQRMVFAVLLVSLAITGRAFTSDAGSAGSVSGAVIPSQSGPVDTNTSSCLTASSKDACGRNTPLGITYATTTLNWRQIISSSLTGGSPTTITLTPCPVGIDTTSGV